MFRSSNVNFRQVHRLKIFQYSVSLKAHRYSDINDVKFLTPFQYSAPKICLFIIKLP